MYDPSFRAVLRQLRMHIAVDSFCFRRVYIVKDIIVRGILDALAGQRCLPTLEVGGVLGEILIQAPFPWSLNGSWELWQPLKPVGAMCDNPGLGGANMTNNLVEKGNCIRNG